MRTRADFAAALRRTGSDLPRHAGRGGVVVHLAAGAMGAAESARVGFVVSKAVGNSVVRHRVTRRLRYVVRARLDRLPEGSLVVIRARPAAAGADSHALGDDVDAAFARLGLPR